VCACMEAWQRPHSCLAAHAERLQSEFAWVRKARETQWGNKTGRQASASHKRSLRLPRPVCQLQSLSPLRLFRQLILARIAAWIQPNPAAHHKHSRKL
jgi:hypothetical protein